MSNHYHLVLHINKAQAEKWTTGEIIEQWHQLFNGTLFSQRYANNETLLASEFSVLTESVEKWRSQLMDISWFTWALYLFTCWTSTSGLCNNTAFKD